MGIVGSKEDIDIKPGFLLALKNNPDGTIISVGSGFGVTEKKLEDEYNISIITIDPLEEKFAKPDDMNLAKLPIYNTCEDFLKDRGLSDNITMMLDWPSPNEATYGVDAISLIKPLILIVRYASCGAAGSFRLQSFLASCGCPHDYIDYTDFEMDRKYKLLYTSQKVIGSGRGFDGKTLNVVVLKRISSFIIPRNF